MAMTNRTKKSGGKQSFEGKTKGMHHDSGLFRRARLKLFVRRNRAVLRAGAIFSFCILVFTLAYSPFLNSAAFSNVETFTAGATSFILGLLSIPTEVKGTVVSLNNFSVKIVAECTGIVPMLIFISAVLAYPCRIKQKLAGVGIGIAGLYLLNLVRTVSLFWIGSVYPDLFNTAHFLVWQALMILFAVILWLFWVEKIVTAQESGVRSQKKDVNQTLDPHCH
ncbi:MAG: exosortase H [bacterium]|nr:exosortase H [bacterium]